MRTKAREEWWAVIRRHRRVLDLMGLASLVVCCIALVAGAPWRINGPILGVFTGLVLESLIWSIHSKGDA